jgi:phosphoribosylaminoimidazole (AIR) synthetase
MIYVKPVMDRLRRSSTIPVHGLAHITGGFAAARSYIQTDGD